MTSWLQKHSSAALWDFRTLWFSDVFFTLFSTLQSKYLSLQLMNSCQHYKSGCLRNKKQKPCRFFNIYGLQPTVPDLSPSESTQQPFGSRTMAIWSCVAGIFTPVMDWQNGSWRFVTSGGSLESQVTTSFTLEKNCVKTSFIRKKLPQPLSPHPTDWKPTSVTGCSTCNRGFNSKKQKVSLSGPGSVPNRQPTKENCSRTGSTND